jgi:hypothetical protein
MPGSIPTCRVTDATPGLAITVVSESENPATGIRSSLERTVLRLDAAGVPDEALAEFVVRKRLLGVARAPQMRPLGRVWPLGVLLLARDGRLFATGKVTRAVPEGYPGYQSPGVEVRRGYRAAAHNGRFVEGDTVNFDTVEIVPEELDGASTPLLLDGSAPRVRWNPTHPGQSRALDVYLADRAGLLIEPPGEN